MCGLDWCRQFGLLLKKNCILKKRSALSSIFEIVLPVGVMALLCLVRNQISVDNVPAKHFIVADPTDTSFNREGQPVGRARSLFDAYRPSNSGGGGGDAASDATTIDTFPRVAIAPRDDPVVMEFAANLNTSFLVDYVCDTCGKHRNCPNTVADPCDTTLATGRNCTTFALENWAAYQLNIRRGGSCSNNGLLNQNSGGPQPQQSPCYNSNSNNNNDCSQSWNQAYPGPIPVLTFATEADMEAYVGDAGYDTTLPVIAAGIVFAHAEGASVGAGNKWSYTLRGNNSIIPSTSSDTDDFQLVDNTKAYNRYTINGLLWLQSYVDEWIIKRSRAAAGVTGDEAFEWSTWGWEMPVPAHREDLFANQLISVVPLFYLLAFLYPTARVVRSLVEEKETRIKEGMRMMGLVDSAFWCSWFVSYAIQFLVTAVLVVLVGAGTNTLYKHSEPFWIGLWFFSFCVAMIAYGTAISTLFSKAKMAGTFAYILIFGAYVPVFVMNSDTYSEFDKTAACLLPPTAFGLGAIQITVFEGYELGITADTMSRVNSNFTFTDSLVMMWVDIVVYCIITWYLDAVWPSEWGTRRPPWFCVTRSYWAPTCTCCAPGKCCGPALFGNHAAEADEVLKAQDPAHFEVVGENVKALGAGVEVHGIRKVWDDGNVAVAGVSTTMYNGQIFCLLGHNGAGKTTLISALTGMTEVSAGDATVAGASAVSQMGTVRQRIGVCPQHDILYPNLTVREHLELFANLKGVPADRVEGEIKKLVEEIGLTEKINAQAQELSGGQKRKLSVAIAFVGDSRVVFLDEPSSGMDPYSRRALWEMLVRMKAGKVIVLTTHFMDEADILGDRIAIMTHGQIQCCGSSLFLKELYGVGYSMTITREKEFEDELRRKKELRKQQLAVSVASGGAADAAGAGDAKFAGDVKGDNMMDDDPLVALIKARLGPGAEQTSTVGAELGYRVPLAASKQFPALFQEMDANRKLYQIRDYGVGVTTLEEVFLKVGGADAKTRKGAVFRQMSSGSLDAANNAVQLKAKAELDRSACDVCCTHLGALYRKRFHYAKRDTKAVIFQLFIPIVFLILGFVILRTSSSTSYNDKLLGPQNWNQPLYLPFNARDLDANSALGQPNDLLHNLPSMARAVKDVTLEPWASASAQAFSDDLLSHIPDHEQSRYLALYFATDRELNASCQYRDSTMQSGGCSFYSNGGGQQNTGVCSRGAWNNQNGGQLVDYSLNLGLCQEGTVLPSYCPNSCPNNTYEYWNGGKLIFSYLWNNTAYHVLPIAQNVIHSALLRNSTSDPNADIQVSVHPFDATYRQRLLRSSADGFSAAIVTVIAFVFIPASYAIFVVREREIKAKHLQSISGVSPLAYWTGALMWDLTNYLIPFGAAVLVVYLFDNPSFVGENFGPTVLVFALYGPAVAPFSYMFSFAFKSHSTAQTVLILVYFLTGLLLMITSFALEILPSTQDIAQTLKYVFRLFPTFCLGDTMVQLAARPFFSLLTGESLGPWSNRVSVYNIGFLIAEIFGYFAITILLEYVTNTPACMCGDSCLPGAAYPEPQRVSDERAEDNDVQHERQRMNDNQKAYEMALAQAGANGQVPAPRDAIRILGLRKVYPGHKVAVRNLSYGVGQGECFGFLGINGAGKTTTLSILSGEFPPTAGSASLLNQDIVTQQDKCRRLLGYCPQFDALLDLMTAREHLFMFARFKGVPEAQIPGMVDAMIERLSLKEYADRPSGTYSGGNKRKLSVAIALIGDPPIVFLDEPSTGMDPVSRRFMWDFISTTMKGRSVILTTHSMEECEALCHRLGIMVGGVLRCIGTPQHIKSRFAQGFQLDLHTGDGPSVDADIRAWMAQAFPAAQLAEFHPTRYKYQLPPDLTLAFIFGAIETNKERLTIKEYSVGQTTLEQVFIEFAKQQNEEKGQIKSLLTAQLSHRGSMPGMAPAPANGAAPNGGMPQNMAAYGQQPSFNAGAPGGPGGAAGGAPAPGPLGYHQSQASMQLQIQPVPQVHQGVGVELQPISAAGNGVRAPSASIPPPPPNFAAAPVGGANTTVPPEMAMQFEAQQKALLDMHAQQQALLQQQASQQQALLQAQYAQQQAAAAYAAQQQQGMLGAPAAPAGMDASQAAVLSAQGLPAAPYAAAGVPPPGPYDHMHAAGGGQGMMPPAPMQAPYHYDPSDTARSMSASQAAPVDHSSQPALAFVPDAHAGMPPPPAVAPAPPAEFLAPAGVPIAESHAAAAPAAAGEYLPGMPIPSTPQPANDVVAAPVDGGAAAVAAAPVDDAHRVSFAPPPDGLYGNAAARGSMPPPPPDQPPAPPS